ncbi:MAG TPA: histidinol dehydrogenase [Streptosporangiaceae bacterium]
MRDREPAGLSRVSLSSSLPRATLDVAAAAEQIRPVCEDVRQRGAAAVREYTARFDGVDLETTRVPPEALEAALGALDPAVARALEEAARRARLVHEAQLPPAENTVSPASGLTVTARYVPVSRAGVYVPGGLVAYPSSVVMNVVPAQVAGVASVAVASPPQKDGGGLPHPAVLAACALLGVDEVHAVGGAQALAMFAYGTDVCAPADVLTGPGNVYVAAAKRLLGGVVGTDGENGPTEIAIIADHTADAAFVAADLIAQAEHDPLAACLLITSDPALPDRVDAELARQLPAAPNRERIEQALAGQSAYVLVRDVDSALAVSDAWAPEHLEVQTEDAGKVATRVRNAGAIFAGPYSPVSLGDYLAGSNHVLPTGGTARHAAGLTVLPFLKLVNVIECEREGLAGAAPFIDALGGEEQLAAHVAAVRVRIPE